MKKILVFVLGLCLCFAIMGCGGSGGSSENSLPPSEGPVVPIPTPPVPPTPGPHAPDGPKVYYSQTDSMICVELKYGHNTLINGDNVWSVSVLKADGINEQKHYENLGSFTGEAKIPVTKTKAYYKVSDKYYIELIAAHYEDGKIMLVLPFTNNTMDYEIHSDVGTWDIFYYILGLYPGSYPTGYVHEIEFNRPVTEFSVDPEYHGYYNILAKYAGHEYLMTLYKK